MDLLLLDFEEDLDREFELPDDVGFDVEEDERSLLLFAREFPLDLDVAVLLPPDELELERPLPVVFVPMDFLAPDEELDELPLLPPRVFEPELELFDEDGGLRDAVDLVPAERPRDVEDDLGTIVSAAAPTAPTAAPAAAPLNISLATSITLSTIFEAVERFGREEFRFDLEFFCEGEVDAFAICFLRKCS